MHLAPNLWEITMAKTKTRHWDIAQHLQTDVDVVAYLEAALEDGNPSLITAALDDIARAKGMSQIADKAGLGRESLYKLRSSRGRPEFATVLKVVRSLGLKLRAEAAPTFPRGQRSGHRHGASKADKRTKVVPVKG